MATSRSLGRTSFITSRSISIVPSLTSSSPAMARSSVVLPQPDGPTSTVNSPSGMSRSTPRTACTPLKCLCSPVIFSCAISPLSAAYRAKRQAAHEMALHEHPEQDRRHERDDRQRARFAIGRSLKTEKAAEDRRQRKGAAQGQDQGEEELGPAEDEREHGGGDDAGQRQRQRHPPQGTPTAMAVDEGRLLQLRRHLAEIGKHHP